LLFATTRTTRKYANLLRNPKVAMVIDNRTNQPTDFHTAIAVTATGAVEEVRDPERIRLLRRYLSKHPYLKEFATSLTCALLKMEVDTYFVVSKFQNVMELHINK
jgi:nitroimidazol reductase NimA-like FMN-containing flavoprotein (pyridoxamine 5'-phosphate oxidase superfamily)